VVIEVVPKLLRSKECSICQLLVVGVALLGFCQDLADKVDWPLYTVVLRFFLAFHHNDDADDPIGCRHV
jgi:hypothetical protein